jgi:hypothetical protein
MTFLMFILALYGLFTLGYQVTGMAISAVALIRKADRAAATLINMPPQPVDGVVT